MQRNCPRIVGALAGFLIFILPVRADLRPDPPGSVPATVVQAPDTNKPVQQLPPIIVIGERMNEPVSTTIISKETINKLKADKVSDLLSGVCGVSIQDYGGLGGVQSAILRTAGSSARSLVLVNGRPANDPYNGGFNFTLVGPNLLDHLTVYRGSFSHLFGRDALGGLVTLTTKSLDTDEPYAKFDVAQGAFGTHRYQFDFGRSLVRNTSIYLASDIENTQGYRDSSAASLASVSGNLSVRFRNDLKIRWDVLYHEDRIQTPGRIGYPSFGEQADRRWDGDIVLELPGRTQVVGYYTRSRLDYRYSGDSSWSRYASYGLTGSKDFKFGSHQAGFGLDVQQTNALSSAIRERSLFEGGGLVGYVFDRGPAIASATVRFDRLHTGETSLNPSVKAGFRLKRAGDRPGGSGDRVDVALFYAGFGRSFRSPTVTELYWPVDSVWRYRGNPGLKSESGVSFELGSRIKTGRLFLEAAGYHSRNRNLITTGMDPDSFYTKVNIDSVSSFGVEGAVKIEPVPGLIATISHSQFWAETNLPFTPPYHTTVAVEYRLPLFAKRILPFVRLEAVFAGSRFDPYAIDGRGLEAYQVYNLIAEVKVIDLTLYGRVGNLFDRQYDLISGYPMPPRHWRLGAAWEFLD